MMRFQRPTAPMSAIGAMCLVSVIGLFVDVAHGFCLLNVRWADGRVEMTHNFPPSGRLINGTLSWGENAELSMLEWSAITDGFRFVIGGVGPAGQDARDGLSNMVFDDNVDGTPFEEDVLAITFTRTRSDGEGVESDIIFNTNIQWDAYSGPIRADRNGTPIFDFRRVVLHELGHVLGLDHPDGACGQSVEAVMNARTTDTDALTDDDRNGVSFLYADGNQPPIANAGRDQQGNGLQPFLLNGGASRDPDGRIESYVWTRNGEFVSDKIVFEVDLNFGTHVLVLTVTDDDGATDSDSVIIEVGNVPSTSDPNNLAPVADAGEDRTVASGEVVVLDGRQSSDPDGTVERYIWSEGDTILGRDPVVPIALSVGTRIISLTVFDDDGGSDSDTVVVTVVRGDDVDSGPIVQSSPRGGSPCGALGWITLTTFVLLPMTTRARSGRRTRVRRLVRSRRTCCRCIGRSWRRGQTRGSDRV